jgi:hypothetical protein
MRHRKSLVKEKMTLYITCEICKKSHPEDVIFSSYYNVEIKMCIYCQARIMENEKQHLPNKSKSVRVHCQHDPPDIMDFLKGVNKIHLCKSCDDILCSKCPSLCKECINIINYVSKQKL